jgi:hypothetical protein
MAVFARGNVVVSKKNWIKKGRYKSVRAKSKSVQSVLCISLWKWRPYGIFLRHDKQESFIVVYRIKRQRRVIPGSCE